MPRLTGGNERWLMVQDDDTWKSKAFPVQTESSGQIRNAEYRDFELFTVSVKL